MQDFIDNVVGQLGIERSVAESATGSLLSLLQQEGDQGSVGALLDKLPGADSLIGAGGEGGGGLGAAVGGLGKMLGGGAGGAGALASLMGAGLDGDQLGKLVQMFLAYAKEHAGSDLVERVVASAPQLKQLVG